MVELTEQNAADVLHAAGHLADPRQVRVRELSGGVSNIVLLIEQPAGGPLPERFVVKQARGKLRVQADWRCSIERIWREVEVLQICESLLNEAPQLQHATVPQVLWTNESLYAYAMSAAPADSRTWKEQLLTSRVDESMAGTCGTLLGTLHGHTWHDESIETALGDRTFFNDLRLSPYYRVAANNCPELASQLNALVDQTWYERHALVHGDFSPKNLLISGNQIMLIDFEVGHYGDPAFDLGFFLTHLVLKSIHLPAVRQNLLTAIDRFWQGYAVELSAGKGARGLCRLEVRTARNLAGCLVARVHGKSPVDYLTSAEQDTAIRVATALFALGPQGSWSQVRFTLHEHIV